MGVFLAWTKTRSFLAFFLILENIPSIIPFNPVELVKFKNFTEYWKLNYILFD